MKNISGSFIELQKKITLNDEKYKKLINDQQINFRVIIDQM